MSGLFIAADLSALGAAARTMSGAGKGSGGSQVLPDTGHPEGDAALADFHSAMRDHGARLAQHASAGAASLHGYAVAFHLAGD